MPAPNAHRNLLLGILALHMDFITREQLAAAIRPWVKDKSGTLADILIEHGALSETDRQLLAPLVERHIANHAGDAVLSLAAPSSIGSVAEDLQQLVDEDVGSTGPPSRRSRHFKAPSRHRIPCWPTKNGLSGRASVVCLTR